MKKIFSFIVAISFLVIIGCTNSGSKNEQEKPDMDNMNKDTTKKAVEAEDKEVKTVTVTYKNVNATAAASIKEIVDHYILVKNALAADNGGEAAEHSKAMEGAISKLDKSLLTADQKKVYDGIEDDLKEHAEHIGKNSDNIKHQREHFSMMSEDVYDMVKAFGGGRELFHDHCPMYDNNKGAMWISERKEIRNPYLGASMPTCGSVEEVIK